MNSSSPASIPFPLRLSQTQLSLLDICPRKFQHSYLDQLAAPIDLEQQERQDQGSRFHLLMQQWQLGLPIGPLLETDVALQHWFTAFTLAAPQILGLDDGGEGLRQSEQPRTLEFQGYLLTAVYDLLLLGDRQARILDWKTYPRPRKPDWLLQHWQTRLYPFILAETSHYTPEQVSLVYWFFQSRGSQAEIPEAQSLTIAYDTAKHEQTRQELSQRLADLTHWMTRYQSGEPFPQVGRSQPCEVCNFAVRCDRPSSPQPETDHFALPNLATIPEVIL